MKNMPKYSRIISVSIFALLVSASCCFALSDAQYVQYKRVSKHFSEAEAELSKNWKAAQKYMAPADFRKLKLEQRKWLASGRDRSAEGYRGSVMVYNKQLRGTEDEKSVKVTAEAYALAALSRSSKIHTLVSFSKSAAKNRKQEIFFDGDVRYIIIAAGSKQGWYSVTFHGERWGDIFSGGVNFGDAVMNAVDNGNKFYVYEPDYSKTKPAMTIARSGGKISVDASALDNMPYWGMGVYASGDYYKW